jgi:hypothetical protein
MLAVAVVGLAVAGSHASAASILPNDVAVVPTLEAGFPGVATLEAVLGPTVMTTGPGTLTAELTSWVYRETVGPFAGYLTFAWQVKVLSGTANSLSVSDFMAAAGNAGDVGYKAEGGRDAISATWFSPGAFLSWTFEATAAGELSPLMFFRTKTKVFKPGAQVLLQGTGQNQGSGFLPVPEPGTLALAFAAIPALGLYGLRRRARS